VTLEALVELDDDEDDDGGGEIRTIGKKNRKTK
jgi:hypothetical protein